ncbi:uncharacterized protein LOC131596949 [Vicia villosa]|uniref:uncharacterized protein LOC131596949 n=1 Tax=Vicia villosa TaxID=3911 RepID=UPI00273C6A7E|nr:uncharacterized protein LOC131596949 [Vicia villosa]
MENISVSLASSFWRTPGVDFSFLPSSGAAGGILTLWNSNTMRVLNSFGERGYLGLKVVWREKLYYAVNIYSSSNLVKKRNLWDRLLYLKNIFSDGEWVLGGDFNAVRNRREKKVASFLNSSMEWSEFEEFIRVCGVEDVPSQLVGDRDISYHCLVRLLNDKSNWGPKPFKVNKEWFSNKGFIPFVRKEWLSIKVYGRGDFVLKEKLRILKEKLRWWNANIFGKFDLEVEENVRILNDGDEEVGEDDNGESNEVLERKRRASKDIW